MKHIMLLANRLRAAVRSNKLVFALYAVGAMLAVSSMLLMYMVQISQVKYDKSDGYYIYDVYSENAESFPIAAGRNAAASLVSCIEDKNNLLWNGYYHPCKLESIAQGIKEDWGEMLVSALVLTDGHYYDRGVGNIDLQAPSGEAESKSYPVVVSAEILRAYGNENTVGSFAGMIADICGAEHEIIQIHHNMEEYIMFLPDDPSVQELEFQSFRFVCRFPLTSSEISKVEKLSGTLFSAPAIHSPENPEQEALDLFWSNFFAIAGFTGIAMFGFAFLFKFIIESRANEIRVMLLCGSSRRRVCFNVLEECLLVNFAFGCAGLLLFGFVKDRILNAVVATTVLKMSDYLIILACFLGVSVLVCCPMLYSYVTKTIIEVKRRYAG